MFQVSHMSSMLMTPVFIQLSLISLAQVQFFLIEAVHSWSSYTNCMVLNSSKTNITNILLPNRNNFDSDDVLLDGIFLQPKLLVRFLGNSVD